MIRAEICNGTVMEWDFDFITSKIHKTIINEMYFNMAYISTECKRLWCKVNVNGYFSLYEMYKIITTENEVYYKAFLNNYQLRNYRGIDYV